MRNSTALKKNLKIKFRYWKTFVETEEWLSMKIDDIEICVFGPRCIRTIESIFNHQFKKGEEIELIAETFKVDNRDLYINNQYVIDFDYKRMWLINEAFAKVTGYHIAVNHDNLSWTFSWSLDWHVQNLSGRVEDIDNIKPEDLEKTLSKLKKKYSKLVTHNSYYAFEIIEYRGKDYNRLFRTDSIGCVPENFDENIRKEVWKEN